MSVVTKAHQQQLNSVAIDLFNCIFTVLLLDFKNNSISKWADR